MKFDCKVFCRFRSPFSENDIKTDISFVLVKFSEKSVKLSDDVIWRIFLTQPNCQKKSAKLHDSVIWWKILRSFET